METIILILIFGLSCGTLGFILGYGTGFNKGLDRVKEIWHSKDSRRQKF